MATELIMQGGSIELSEEESFNKVRNRLNVAAKNIEDFAAGNIDGETKGQEFKPYHHLSFKTADGGRIAVNPEKIIAVTSDLPNDKAGADDDEE